MPTSCTKGKSSAYCASREQTWDSFSFPLFDQQENIFDAREVSKRTFEGQGKEGNRLEHREIRHDRGARIVAAPRNSCRRRNARVPALGACVRSACAWRLAARA